MEHLKIYFFITALTSILSSNANAENYSKVLNCSTVTHNDTLPENDTAILNKIFTKVDIEATFPGGEKAWRQFLEQNLNAAAPAKKKAPAGTYTVVIQFIVDKEGYVSDIVPLTSHGYGMEAEVVRLLKNAPRWKPAMQNGRPVKAYRKQPVTFLVIEEEKKKYKRS
jgi:hypothetical protein